MRIETRRVGRVLVVRCAGELDLASAPEFRKAVDSQLEDWAGVNGLVLNLGQVSFVDSSGLGAILGRYKRIRQRGGLMVLVDVPEPVRRLLEFSGIFRIIPSRATEEEALTLA